MQELRDRSKAWRIEVSKQHENRAWAEFEDWLDREMRDIDEFDAFMRIP